MVFFIGRLRFDAARFFLSISCRGGIYLKTLLGTAEFSYPIYGATSSVSYSDYFFNY